MLVAHFTLYGCLFTHLHKMYTHTCPIYKYVFINMGIGKIMS